MMFVAFEKGGVQSKKKKQVWMCVYEKLGELEERGG